jgi:hypothetical protein
MASALQRRAGLLSYVAIAAGLVLLTYGTILAPILPYLEADAVVTAIGTSPPDKWNAIALQQLRRSSALHTALTSTCGVAVLFVGEMLRRAVKRSVSNNVPE